MKANTLIPIISLYACAQASFYREGLDFGFDAAFNTDEIPESEIGGLAQVPQSGLQDFDSLYSSYSSSSSVSSSSFPQEIAMAESFEEAFESNRPGGFVQNTKVSTVSDLCHLGSEGKVAGQISHLGSLMNVSQEAGDEPSEWNNLVSIFSDTFGHAIDSKLMLQMLVILVDHSLDVKISKRMAPYMNTDTGLISILRDMLFQYRWNNRLFPYTQSAAETFKYLARLANLSKMYIKHIRMGELYDRIQRCIGRTDYTDVKSEIDSLLSTQLQACGGELLDSSHTSDAALESVLLFLERSLILEDDEIGLTFIQDLNERTLSLVKKLCLKDPKTAHIDVSLLAMEDAYLRLVEELQVIAKSVNSVDQSTALISPSQSTSSSNETSSAIRNEPSSPEQPESQTIVSSSTSTTPRRREPSRQIVQKPVSPIKKTRKPYIRNEKSNEKKKIVYKLFRGTITEAMSRLMPFTHSNTNQSLRRFIYFFIKHCNVSVPRDALIRKYLTETCRLWTLLHMVLDQYIQDEGIVIIGKVTNLKLLDIGIEVAERPENMDAFTELTDEQVLEYLTEYFEN